MLIFFTAAAAVGGVVAALLLALQNEIYFNAFALLLLFIHLP